MNTFIENQTLEARSACNYDCIFTGKVIKRTAKTVTVDIKSFGEKRCKIHNTGDGDFIYPLGRYSMAPIFRA